MLDTAAPVRELSFGDAIKEAIAEEMRRDPRVVLMGEDVAEAGTTFKVLTGLVDEFGKDRIALEGFNALGEGAIGISGGGRLVRCQRRQCLAHGFHIHGALREKQ